MQQRDLLIDIWKNLYPGTSTQILENYLLTPEVSQNAKKTGDEQVDWYKDAVVYSLYADLFNTDFAGLTQKLDYLHDLGVNCIWLLPVLDSPMRDAGFDISDYTKIRAELLDKTGNTSDQQIFWQFLSDAHQKGIRVIFDISMNHTSDEHPWFVEASKSKDNPFRDYYIWSDDTTLYKDARIIFKGIESSNWEKKGDQYYFHRFFNFQPDLNYRNPQVLIEISKVLLFWQNAGVDGFRADATPYIWKEEGTECENLNKTHLVVKFFRAILDYVAPGSLLLAEACQQPAKVVEYMGSGDECQAAYHFPLMPRIFKSIAMHSGKPIEETLSGEFTPELPESGQWFTFLRCHDELSLELVYVTEEERKYIHQQYCLRPEWNFRLGEGISARLSELMQRDERRILLAFSIILTLPGTPVIYYGDEFGKLNDEAYYNEMISLTGKDDTRFLCRGKINWDELSQNLANPESLSSKIYDTLKRMLHIRNQHKTFGRGSIEFITLPGAENGELLSFIRPYEKEKWLIIHNMTDQSKDIVRPAFAGNSVDVFTSTLPLVIEPYGFRWMKIF
ncbi:MAG: alpha-amylase family glycosyl hydrolase [Bacteroidota bacterium]